MFNKQSFSDLASEGERLCKSGDSANGIKFFQMALEIYEQNKHLQEQEQKMLPTIAIIYNQMGNAFFNLQDYTKALEYHKKDLQLSEQFGDESGKAKACGNIGNTLQLLGDYDEAILYLLKNLDISKNLSDSVIFFKFFVFYTKKEFFLIEWRSKSFVQFGKHISIKGKVYGQADI